eukprot:CAMPEP_0169083104 /NCGR_PEP_ID=MMETSP1015-20121227/11900_1 /TAXON_ID=342587 /ORGANISM="Karlodinium micrum, Strain CCMP2283" /LENGTH=545 /DNA_ID=CAMNT_0009143005 /DNA_START=70 /DNA_END=1703 /DNA_ORIENTATION=+
MRRCWINLAAFGAAPFLLIARVSPQHPMGFDDLRETIAIVMPDDFKSDETSFLQLQVSHSPQVAKPVVHSKSLAWNYFTEPVIDGGVNRASPKHDWLFNYVNSTSCREPVWDNTDKSLLSRIFLPVFVSGLVGLVLYSGSRISSSGESSDSDVARTDPTPNVRRCDLDYARIVCVACVVIEHSGGTNWIRHNTVFVLTWFLPFLYITSGISFIMSKRTTLAFNARLGILFAIGVGANLVADAIGGRNWTEDFGNTIFQMFYVLMLIFMSFVAAPLRFGLLWRKEHPGARAPVELWLWMLVFGTIAATSLVYVAMGRSFLQASEPEFVMAVKHGMPWDIAAAPMLNHAPIAVFQVAGCMFLSHLACLLDATDILPWLLLAHIFVPRILIPWPRVGFPQNLELFIFAMVAEAWTIRGYQIIRKVVHNYWPIMVFLFMITSVPDYVGRCDLFPPNTCWERLRYYSIEFALCLFLSAGAFNVTDPYAATEWLTYWALYAYCFHVAWARLLPMPYGAVLTFSSVVVFYAVFRATPVKEQASSGQCRVDSG